MKKYFAISDPHGFLDAVKKALRKAGFDMKNKDHILIICGDLLDRGLQAIEMLNFVQKLVKQDRIIYIRGNHEDLYLDCLEEIKKFNEYESYPLINPIHHHNGTYSTCQQLAIRQEEFKSLILNKTVNYFELGNYIFVHGWIPVIVKDKLPSHYAHDREFEFNPNWKNASEEDWDAARWINGIKAAREELFEEGKTIVCGHWHTGYGHDVYHGIGESHYDCCDIYRDEGIIALDACTAYSNKVNVLVIEEKENGVYEEC